MLLPCKSFAISCKLLSLVGVGVEELVPAFASALDEELAAEAGNASLDGDDVDGDSASQTINEPTVSGKQMQASNQGAVSGNPFPGAGPNRGQGLHGSSPISKNKESPRLAACAQSRDS